MEEKYEKAQVGSIKRMLPVPSKGPAMKKVGDNNNREGYDMSQATFMNVNEELEIRHCEAIERNRIEKILCQQAAQRGEKLVLTKEYWDTPKVKETVRTLALARYENKKRKRALEFELASKSQVEYEHNETNNDLVKHPTQFYTHTFEGRKEVRFVRDIASPAAVARAIAETIVGNVQRASLSPEGSGRFIKVWKVVPNLDHDTGIQRISNGSPMTHNILVALFYARHENHALNLIQRLVLPNMSEWGASTFSIDLEINAGDAAELLKGPEAPEYKRKVGPAMKKMNHGSGIGPKGQWYGRAKNDRSVLSTG